MASLYSYHTNEAPEWPMARKIRQRIYDLLTTKNKSLAVAAAIAASELVENVVKFGKPEIAFICEIDSDVLTLSASNEIDQIDDLDSLKSYIDEIRAADDPFNLYVTMAQKVMEQKRSASRLGLFRIAGEAEFLLDYLESGKRITVFARRRVSEMLQS